VLMLPEGITERLTPAQVKAIIAHEMCHVRRRDNLTAAIHMLVETAFWFHPIVWWIGSRMVEERERACDEEVLRLGGDPEIYAEGILNVCKFYVESPLSCVSGISGSDLKKRIVRIMTGALASNLSFARKLLLAATGITAIAMPLAFGLANTTYLSAQSSAADWEKAAGGHMSFDVASVKQNTAAIGPQTLHSNIPLGPQEASISTGGLLSSTDWPLSQYMAFAFKLTPSEVQAVQSQLPKWANTNRYDIQARAWGNPSEDQFRLMVQALLADRFKLAIHRETRQLPIMALVLDKPGKLGPQLRAHPEGWSCVSAPSNSTPGEVPTTPEGFPTPCRALSNLPPSAPGRTRLGARGVPMSMITILFNVSQISGVDRPLVDKTGLTGKIDFVIEFAIDYSNAKGPLDLMYIPIPAGTPPPPDPTAPTFLEALKEQLGLKLEPQTGPVEVLVIDHVEAPSTN
jgi:bla regulator protein blaR1